jgi:crossover junction endodeoxyribonuclease RuvC
VVLGIDPGTGITGYAVIDGSFNHARVKDAGIIKTPSDMDFPARLSMIRSELSGILDGCTVTAAAVEKLFFSVNKKTGIAVSHARGVVLELLHSRGIPVYEYSPNQVKKAVCGQGKADKKIVQHMVSKILGLNKTRLQDDAADAMAAALCHLSISPQIRDAGIKG